MLTMESLDLVRCFTKRICLLRSTSIQPRTDCSQVENDSGCLAVTNKVCQMMKNISKQRRRTTRPSLCKKTGVRYGMF